MHVGDHDMLHCCQSRCMPDSQTRVACASPVLHTPAQTQGHPCAHFLGCEKPTFIPSMRPLIPESIVQHHSHIAPFKPLTPLVPSCVVVGLRSSHAWMLHGPRRQPGLGMAC